MLLSFILSTNFPNCSLVRFWRFFARTGLFPQLIFFKLGNSFNNQAKSISWTWFPKKLILCNLSLLVKESSYNGFDRREFANSLMYYNNLIKGSSNYYIKKMILERLITNLF